MIMNKFSKFDVILYMIYQVVEILICILSDLFPKMICLDGKCTENHVT